jgi:hypothetical protein
VFRFVASSGGTVCRRDMPAPVWHSRAGSLDEALARTGTGVST